MSGNPYGDPGADPAHEWAQTEGNDMQEHQQDSGRWERPERLDMADEPGRVSRWRTAGWAVGAAVAVGAVTAAIAVPLALGGDGGVEDTGAGTRDGVPVTWHPTAAETPPPGVGTVEPAAPVDTAATGNPWQDRADTSTRRWDDASRDAIDAQNERVFLEVVRSEGVRFPSDADAVEYGRAVCADVDRTGSVTVTAMSLFADPAPLSSDEAAYMVGASIAAFCPEHEASLWEFVDSTW